MVESRITLCLQVYIGLAADYPALTLVDGYPDASSLTDFFEAVPMVLEASDLSESSEDTPQGELITYQLRTRVGRESDFFRNWIHARCMAAVELANGEKLLVGSADYPLRYQYARNTGAEQTAQSDTTMTFATTVPVI